ncbi:type I restriction enzyme endonuclease domain-containing protein [Methylobacter tundripaludum]|uniref:type I restriction enzyme endonuclease domain-containing protein n=1 Tax=Methylobacter tundripaludum TaxID=173365 RepID=UPI00280071DB|nr:type I restriction enzyme endonuclease domain-containing protein [Methylobacter tundripaludum]
MRLEPLCGSGRRSVSDWVTTQSVGTIKLRELAVVLITQRVRENATIDWKIKESVRSTLKVAVRLSARHAVTRY